jgi:hypothetical protein
MEYFNSFAYALSSNKELSLKVEIACNDKVIKEAIYKISATFE